MTAKRILLPKLVLSDITSPDDCSALLVREAIEPYYVRPKMVPSDGKRRDGKPLWAKHEVNLFPVVLDGNGVPWGEATVYLVSRLEDSFDVSVGTLASIADDLAAYRRFLEEHDVDWMFFPKQKLSRPTYRFNGHLKFAIGAGELSPTTAKRRMGSVIGFYRWLANEGAFVRSEERR